MIRTRVSGFGRAQRALAALAVEGRREADRSIEEAAELVRREIADRAPHRSGRLEESIIKERER